MSYLLSDGKILRHNNAYGDQGVTMETQHGKDAEIDVLKNTIKVMKLEHKVAIQEKDIQILTLQKENDIQQLKVKNEKSEMNIQILRLEHEIKMLKQNAIADQKVKEAKKKKHEEHPLKSFNEFYMETEDLLSKGIRRFFGREQETQDGFYNHYYDWFQSMTGRIGKNNPVIHEEYVLAKVKCKDLSVQYMIYSFDQNQYKDQYTYLSIFHKGWKHDTTSVLILHPTHINKSIEMEKSAKLSAKCHQWRVFPISKEHRVEDDFFIVLFVKTKKQ